MTTTHFRHALNAFTRLVLMQKFVGWGRKKRFFLNTTETDKNRHGIVESGKSVVENHTVMLSLLKHIPVLSPQITQIKPHRFWTQSVIILYLSVVKCIGSTWTREYSGQAGSEGR